MINRLSLDATSVFHSIVPANSMLLDGEGSSLVLFAAFTVMVTQRNARTDFHESLASLYLKIGNKEKGIERFRIYAKISPNMVSTFDDDLKKAVLNP